MPPAGRMKIAVIDAFERPIVSWDDARLAREIVSRRVAEEAVVQPKKRFWRRKPIVLKSEPIEAAVHEALEGLAREVARL